MRYFLLVYDRRAGALRSEEEFDDEGEALRARFMREREYRPAGDLEVVVLGAESRLALEATHGRYFRSVDQLLARRG